jgi:hypothetical protein
MTKSARLSLPGGSQKRRPNRWPFSAAPKAQNPIAKANGLGINVLTICALKGRDDLAWQGRYFAFSGQIFPSH